VPVWVLVVTLSSLSCRVPGTSRVRLRRLLLLLALVASRPALRNDQSGRGAHHIWCRWMLLSRAAAADGVELNSLALRSPDDRPLLQRWPYVGRGRGGDGPGRAVPGRGRAIGRQLICTSDAAARHLLHSALDSRSIPPAPRSNDLSTSAGSPTLIARSLAVRASDGSATHFSGFALVPPSVDRFGRRLALAVADPNAWNSLPDPFGIRTSLKLFPLKTLSPPLGVTRFFPITV